MFECFEQYYIKANIQIIFSLLEVSYAPIENRILNENPFKIISKGFPLRSYSSPENQVFLNSLKIASLD